MNPSREERSDAPFVSVFDELLLEFDEPENRPPRSDPSSPEDELDDCPPNRDRSEPKSNPPEELLPCERTADRTLRIVGAIDAKELLT